MSFFSTTVTEAATAAPVAPVVPAFQGLGDDTWLARSSALEPHVPVTITSMQRPFHPWQASAYLFANESIARWGGALVGDDMGLGKTQVLLALAADRIAATGKPAIVIAPPVTEGGYMSEIKACFPHLRFATLRGHKRQPLEPADIYFVSDDSRVMQVQLTDVDEVNGKKVHSANSTVAGASIIIRDELHRDKGNQGKPNGRGNTMLAIGAYCRATGTPIVGATGTLLTNRPIEGLIPLTVIGGEALVLALTPGARNVSSFKWRYCAPVEVHIGGGQTRTDFGGLDVEHALELHEYLRRTVYVRREKSDLGEGVLPNAAFLVAPLALPDSAMKRYNRVCTDLYNLIHEEKGKAWADSAVRAKVIVQMNMMRSEAGVAKAQASADYIADLVAQGEQVVAFYEHTDVYLKLGAALSGKGISHVSINGSNTEQGRKDNINDFQNGHAQVMIAQTTAAGIGVTLTAACHAVFLQLPWSAGSLKQACDRILRCDVISADRAARGESITWHVLQACYADGEQTFDANIWNVLLAKAAVTDAVNAGRPVTVSDESVQYEALMAWTPSAKRLTGF